MIDKIRKPVEKEFNLYEKMFNESIYTDNFQLKKVLNYLHSQKGKEIRPVMVLLSAGLFGQITEETLKAAASIEFLHTASLMHDDVVDNTFQRRSGFSVKALWNNKSAILVGDYFLSKSAVLSAQIKNRKITSILADLACELSVGELMQMSNESKLIIDEDAYYEVIKKKTAMTFACCTYAGAISVDADKEAEDHLYKFGEYLGMIFQIKDDIFDYFDSNLIGKPTSNDLKEGKMTLPLIYSLKNGQKSEIKPYLNIIRNKDFSQKNLADINLFVKEAGGVKYAEKRMEDYKSMAMNELSGFPESPYKQSLISCVDYFMLRKY
jgi:octaprenyl-diphosphate synthase